LREAARAARDAATAEHLPILAAATGDSVRWHAEAMLKTIPVHGTREGLSGVIAKNSGLALDVELQSVDGWRDLNVERADFDTYMTWLRSIW
jgi:hypothetical protein